ILLCLRGSRHDVHHRCALVPSVEFGDALLRELHHSGYVGMNGPVAAHVRMETRSVPVSLLANKDLACFNSLTAKALHATPLGSAISAVGGRSACFLMRHDRHSTNFGALRKQKRTESDAGKTKSKDTRNKEMPSTKTFSKNLTKCS